VPIGVPVGENEACGLGLVFRVDGWEGSEDQAVDEGQNGCAASGNAVRGEELVEVREGEIDALGGLEVLGVREEFMGKVRGFPVLLEGTMMGAECGLHISGEEAALAA
jgi:hypothetical protein